MGRRTLLLIASILVAALGTALIWLYVQGADNRAQADTALVQVLFASNAAAPGTAIDQTAPVPKSVPADVALDAVRSPQDVAGQQLKYATVPGQMLLRSMFATGSPTGIDPGKVYVSITITDPHRVPALLGVNKHVAIYALSNQGTERAQLIMDDVKVLTVGATTAAGPNGTQVPGTLVGFAVDPREAVNLIKIETYGQPVLALLGDGAKGAAP